MIRVIKSRRMNVYKGLVRKPQMKILLYKIRWRGLDSFGSE